MYLEKAIHIIFILTFLVSLNMIYPGRLFAAGNKPVSIIQKEEVQLKTVTGDKPVLPEEVTIKYSTGEQEKVKVSWEEIQAEKYQKPGEFKVQGELELLEYPNPLIEQRADPFIYKHTDGYYYFTASVPEYDRIILRQARTIKGLAEAEERVIWRKHEQGIMGKHIWAPELHFIDEAWYIYFAAGSTEDKWAIRQYVLECKDEDPLTGTWREKGKIKMNFESFTLDATTFEHRGGRYLVWAQKDRYGNSDLYIDEMNNPWSISGKQVKIASPKYIWERRGFPVNEGPAVLKRHGRIFLSYSASATDNSYCMGLLTANEDSDLLDPESWKKTRNPVFSSCEETGEYGPGHNTFTVSEDEKYDLLVYHSRPYKEIAGDPLYDPNRHTRVQRLFWNGDGTPCFGIPGNRLNKKLTAVVKVEKR
ncbi:MAG TPA: family 43 glycosylhydrolase [Halanaerobiales bacterium]|nr:family 43 glycosylhydrolase [Halanaerobiales bacterium]